MLAGLKFTYIRANIRTSSYKIHDEFINYFNLSFDFSILIVPVLIIKGSIQFYTTINVMWPYNLD